MRTIRGVWVVALAALACGGGGGGRGGGSTPPTQPPASILYTADGSSADATLALVEGTGSSPTQLRLDLNAQQATGLYGVAFDLLFPSGVLTYVSASQGPFLGSGTSLQVSTDTPGRLVVGLTKLGAVQGVSGSGTLLTLEFRAVGVSGNGAFSFINNNAFDNKAKVISGVTWSGGAVTVTP